MPRKKVMPTIKEMCDKDYIHKRSETFAETYKRLTELKLWRTYYGEREKMMRDGISPGVIEEHLWCKYSPDALVERSLHAKELKDEIGSLGGPTQEDFQWVFTNIDQKKDTYLTTAPSIGAMALLDRAKDDNKVYQWVLDHIAPKTFVEEGGNTFEADKARTLTGISRQIREAFNARRTKLLAPEGSGSKV